MLLVCWATMRNLTLGGVSNRLISSILSRATKPTNMASSTSKNFDYLLLLDFEATCDQGMKQPKPQEIIEFPCLKLSTTSWSVEKAFHRYVRPKVHPVLSDFCTELTGIVQENISDQPTLDEVLNIFDQWLMTEKLHPDSPDASTFAFVTCGDWDLKTLLYFQAQAAQYQLSLPPYYLQWINLKKVFFQSTGTWPRGMMHMLDVLSLKHQGRHHSGIDDCRNIAQICTALGQDRQAIFQLTTQLKPL